MPEPAADVMRMSADNDDQGDQQQELADPGMAETDHSLVYHFYVPEMHTSCCVYMVTQKKIASTKF